MRSTVNSCHDCVQMLSNDEIAFMKGLPQYLADGVTEQTRPVNGAMSYTVLTERGMIAIQALVHSTS